MPKHFCYTKLFRFYLPFQVYLLPLSTIQFIELISAILCVWGVWLNSQPNIWGWPVGLVSVLLAALVYFESRLFAEFGLQIFYAFSSVYGWWKWQTEKDKIHRLTIHRIPQKWIITSLLSGLIFTGILYFVLKKSTTADLPLLDSALAIFSLICQIWLARKYLENWLLWMLINVVSVGVYIYKELWFFTGLYMVLFVLAILGYVRWKKQWKENQVIFTS